MNPTKKFTQLPSGLFIAKGTITSIVIANTLSSYAALAQIIPDASLGTENSRQTTGNIKGSSADLITGGAQRGSSLFHSFSEFNVNNGQRVYFSNPTGIANIFSRVTGNNVSNILGTLGVNGTANLYLLNPKGIIFGKNAQLDIQGAFFTTTANSFTFSDGSKFSATNPQMPLLTMSVPSGVQFGSQPGNISSEGNLSVGKDLTLSARNLKLQGKLKARGDLTLEAKDMISLNGGIVETRIAGKIGNVGTIKITTRNLSVTNGGYINNTTYGKGNAGDILIEASDTISFDGAGIQNGELKPSGLFNTVAEKAVGNGGNVKITTHNLSVTNGAVINSSTYGKGNAGDILIEANDTVSFKGLSINDEFGLLNEVREGAVGKGGNVNIKTRNLFVTNYAQISASTSGQGNAGNIIIKASDTASFDTGFLLNAVAEKAVGNGGIIDITATDISLKSQGLISNAVIAGGKGDGGSINIKTGSLSLIDGARIDASMAGTGNDVGDIFIQADNILLQGLPNQDISNNTGIFTVIQQGGKLSSPKESGSITLKTDKLIIKDNAVLSVDTYGEGNAGDVIVDAKQIELSKGGRIISVVRENGQGNGGNITVKTDNLTAINEGRVSASSLSIGNAGNITIKAKDALTLQTLGRISSSVRQNGKGKAGEIHITSPNINLSSRALIEVNNQNTDQSSSAGTMTLETNFLKLDNASITAKNASGNGGDIEITTQNLLLRRNSQISSTAGSENNIGNGGKISINAKNGYVIAVPTENSDIIANAFSGNGGKINISAIRVLGLETRGRLNTDQLQGIRSNGTNDISASSDVGTDGNVVIQTLSIDPSQGLVAIPINLIDPSRLIAQGCNSNHSNVAQSQNEFVVTGRGGIPPSPDDALTVGALPAKWVTRQKGDRGILPIQIKPATAPLVEAQGMVRNANGDIDLIAQPVISTDFQSGLSSKLCGVAEKENKL
ncbi:filamentous hemagglutinin N-terminal domain-containing protein [Trichormus sp. NMC-1]|uniref:two-partner secretion domain-containing protein n=1 Tax=Trichormus sp. NMC-1 TaxID=1853259 RepID=UPI0008DC1627|nr:filamentous hemagglutinin N-terminal domain-containing protein [Trichormus sp. NMC-1]